MLRVPSHSTVVAYLALFLALGGGAYAVSGTRAPAPSRSIAACYERATGDLRILVRGRCRAGERFLAWSRRGLRGLRGARGAGGPAGPTGPQGPAGAKGDTGTVDTSGFYTKGESDARFASSALFGAPAPADLQGATDNECLLSEVRLLAGTRVPKSWALARGQLLAINQNQPLFSLLGTTYGGNGQTTFALPDLRGAEPRGRGPRGLNYVICIQGLFP